MNTLDALSNELKAFQNRNNLPFMCAFEQLHEDGLTNFQRSWLKDFINRWNKEA